MNAKNNYATPQEAFWAGEFGNEYIGRNEGAQMLASNLSLLSKALKQAGQISSCLEFGANIGMNLRALQLLYPNIHLKAIEINPDATKILAGLIGKDNVFEGSILEYQVTDKADISLVRGVLIHIHPDMLPIVYEKLYQASNRFILIGEYYNPSPVAIPYRGHADRLFKRDFAGEMMEKYHDLKLVDYGFVYHRDPVFPDDDITWFLMEKK